MTPEKARRRLFIGYIIGVIGLLVGTFTVFEHTHPMINILWIGYIFWSAYMGLYIVRRPKQRFFVHLFLLNKNFVNHLLIYFSFKAIIFLMLLTVGMLAAFFGGAFYLQYKWSKIAYF